jgi:hypothetical protein
MVVTKTDGLTAEEVENAVESALVNELNVHASDVEVSYDSDSGVVTYTITSDDAESLVSANDAMQEDSFEDALDLGDDVSVVDFTAPTDVVATVDVTVDASNVDDVSSIVTSVTEALEEQDDDYVVDGQGN